MIIRSKVRISPALCTLGPRLALPHQVGAYVGGGSLQHVCHVINVSGSLARRLLIPDLVICLIWNLSSVCLVVQRLCCYGRTTQFLSGYYATLQLPTRELPLRLLFAFCAHLPSTLEEALG